jgi:hypothetical protein
MTNNQNNGEALNKILNQIKELNLNGETEGIICIAFHQIDDENMNLVASIQGKSGNLSKIIARCVEEDTSLKDILMKGLTKSIIRAIADSKD